MQPSSPAGPRRAVTGELAAAPARSLGTRELPGLVALTLAAIAGNYFAIPLFFGLDFLAGSIFGLLAVQIYGPLWGTAAATIAASYTFFLWGHPWAAVILAAEALTVGVLAPRLRQNLLLADGIYWFLIGMPLVALFYGGVMETGAQATLLVMLKQAVNGVGNALFASLLLTHTRIAELLAGVRRRVVPLRGVVFELLVAAVLLPLVGVVVAGTRQDVRRLESDLLDAIDQTSASLASRLAVFRQHNVEAIAVLAGAADPAEPRDLQRRVELLNRVFPEISSVSITDAGGRIVAADPAQFADGTPVVGTSLAGLPWVEEARRERRPALSGVLLAEERRRPPRIAIAAPVLRDGQVAGFVTGALDVGELRGVLQLYAHDPSARVTLTDSAGLVIASTMPEVAAGRPYRPSGELRPLGHGRYHRLPLDAGDSSINRWRASVYGREVTIGGQPAWHLVVELPVSPLQQFLQRRYLQAFAAMLGVCLLALLLSAAVSSWLARPLADLAEATTGLPDRLSSGELPAWPRSRVAEVDSLARNFRSMAGALEQRFHELTSTGSALRERSVQLATANRELESEVAERRRAEWALRLLAEAGAALAATLEPQPTVERVAACCVPGLADWAFVGVERLRGQPPLVAVAHRDPALQERLRDLAERSPGALVEGGVTLEQPVLLDDPLDSTAMRDDALGNLLRAAGGRSVLLLPLRAHGNTLGTLTLVRGPGAPFDRQTVDVAEELARRAALALDNAALYAELREADRRKDEFLAMLAHELRNPLSPVATSLQLLRTAGDDPAVAERALSTMERQIGHIVRLVDDLLDVARITRGRIQLQRGPLDLRAVVAQSAENLRPRFVERRQELRVELPEEALPLLGDATRLDQVVTNLLANAHKYTPAAGHVAVRLERDGGSALLRVSDDGIGMPPPLLTRVFDLFMQSEQALDRSQGGLGIGLTLVRQLVQMHGGAVEAYSAGEGRGSEFRVRLPLDFSAVPLASPAPAVGGERSGESRRVLVVDDNVEGADSLAELLTLWGHEVGVAHDGPAGLELAARLAPEVVLLDIGLPGMDGYEVARRLRGTESGRAALLIAVTGYGEQVHGGRLEESGFDRLLVKPVRPSQLEELLREMGESEGAGVR